MLAQESQEAEAAVWDLKDAKGKKIDAWRVEHLFIEKIERGEHSPKLHYRIYNRPGSRGIVRQWKFSKKDPKVREAQKRLKEIKKV